MDAKEATTIIQKFKESLDGGSSVKNENLKWLAHHYGPFATFGSLLEKAEGYLEADAQWKERVKPLVEALEAARERLSYEGFTTIHLEYVLSTFRKLTEEK